MSTAPAATWAIPAPDPPSWVVMVTLGYCR